MRKLLSLWLLCALSCVGATLPPGVVGKKIPDYANLPVPPTTYLFLISDPSGNYFNLSLGQLQAMGTNSSTLIITNINVQYLTNLYAYITNLFSTNITAQYLITTNVTIEQPGGLANLNLTPLSLMQSDANDAEASLPNATGVLTNDGSGGMGWTLSLQLTEIDAQNFFPTNLFTGITNAPLLSTDANGKIKNGTPLAATNVTYIAGANLTFTTNADGSIVIASSATITVTTVTNNTFVNTNTFISTSNAFFNTVYITNLYSDTITNNTFVNTNVVILSGKANINTLIITNTTFVNNPANLAATASTVAYWASDKTLGNVANGFGIMTNDGSGATGFNSVYPQGNGAALTNLTYQYNTNAITTGVLTFGQAYRTNIAADITINSLVLGSTVSYESMVLLVTNSDTAVHKITWPSGVFSGGAAAVSWITNGYWSEVLVDHFATLYTNAVTKN